MRLSDVRALAVKKNVGGVGSQRPLNYRGRAADVGITCQISPEREGAGLFKANADRGLPTLALLIHAAGSRGADANHIGYFLPLAERAILINPQCARPRHGRCRQAGGRWIPVVWKRPYLSERVHALANELLSANGYGGDAQIVVPCPR
jgi:hypothetical protein